QAAALPGQPVLLEQVDALVDIRVLVSKERKVFAGFLLGGVFDEFLIAISAKEQEIVSVSWQRDHGMDLLLDLKAVGQ
ncbi:MAG: hypothetical protein IKD70_07980, partial [Eggerthellaceae bacterium]|nr:hypothetical protein [Eggerthellaceae bacterium]